MAKRTSNFSMEETKVNKLFNKHTELAENANLHHAVRKQSTRTLKAERISKFSSDETVRVKALFNKHAQLSVAGEGTKKIRVLKRETFNGLMHAMFELTHMPTLEGLYRAFDANGNNFLVLDEWLIGLSIMTRGDFEQRIDFVWKVYDINEDDILSRGEMYMFLRDAIIGPKNEEDLKESIHDLIELLFRQLDVNADGTVCKKDFFAAVSEKPMLLECLGQVFPSIESLNVFETAIGDETKPQFKSTTKTQEKTSFQFN